MSDSQNRQGIPVTTFLLFFMILTFILQKTNASMFFKIFALQNNFANFYPWQLVTYIFVDNASTFNFFFKALIVFLFSSSIESGWSSGKFILFLLLSILPKSLISTVSAVLIHGLPLSTLLNGTDSLLNPNSLLLSLMIAYGFQHREEVIYLFFIIPIKVWVLSVISIGFALLGMIVSLVSLPLPLNLLFLLIQLSGYTGVFAFSVQIFHLPVINRRLKAFRRQQESPDQEAMQETLEILNNTSVEEVTPKADENDSNNACGPLCSPEDFDPQDNYCKTCARFSRCQIRSQENPK